VWIRTRRLGLRRQTAIRRACSTRSVGCRDCVAQVSISQWANEDLPDTEAEEENRKRKFSRRMGGVHRGRELTECGEVYIGGQWGKRDKRPKVAVTAKARFGIREICDSSAPTIILDGGLFSISGRPSSDQSRTILHL
jgi:hypothetical protein